MINGINSYPYTVYPVTMPTNYPSRSGNPLSPVAPVSPTAPVSSIYADEKTEVIRNPSESRVKEAGRKSSPAECETCSSRKYQDGSNENVSFKSPTHISPEQAASAVRAHEQEHVSNAYTKAAKDNGKVLSATVSLHTAICPECGRSYISGGTTRTQIKYYNEENPYQQQLKTTDAIKYTGMNLNLAG